MKIQNTYQPKIDDFERGVNIFLECANYKHHSQKHSKYSDELHLYTQATKGNTTPWHMHSIKPTKNGTVSNKTLENVYKKISVLSGPEEYENDLCENILVACNKFYRSNNGNKFPVLKRGQKHTPVIENIVLESDENTLQEQLDFAEAIKEFASMVIFTGNKSIHIWIKTRKYFTSNPNDMIEYRYLKTYILKLADQHGIVLDKSVLNDYAKLTRFPNCMNAKSGKYSQLIHSNSSCKTLSIQALKTMIFDSVNREEKEEEKTDSLMVCNFETAKESNKYESNTFGKEYLTTTPNYFQSLNNYFEYIEKGLSGRGERLIMYRHVLNAIRILKANPTLPEAYVLKIGEEKEKTDSLMVCSFSDLKEIYLSNIQTILENSEGRYRMTFEEAMKDAEAYFDKTKTKYRPVRMPDVTDLNKEDILKAKEIKKRLKDLGFEQAHYISKLMDNILYDKLVLLPEQCRMGKLGIHMNNEIRSVVDTRKTKKVMEELKQRNILVKTKNYSVDKAQTNKYFLNMPLVLWIMLKDHTKISWENKKMRSETNTAPLSEVNEKDM